VKWKDDGFFFFFFFFFLLIIIINIHYVLPIVMAQLP
jgi:hypothetical protein